MNTNAYNLHQASLHSQLAKLQQQHLAALQQARNRRQSGPGAHGSHGGHGGHQQIRPSVHHGIQSHPHSAFHSANPSPASSDSEDGDEPMPHPNFEMHEQHPVTHSLKQMSLFQHRTAPTSPAVSRGPSRAGSPTLEGGHSASSGKHGHGSHQARDAKNRSHPYGSSSSAAVAAMHAAHSHSAHSGHGHGHHFSVPNSPRMNAAKHRLSPPDIARSLSGGGGLPRQSVEDILNSSAIPPPPSHSDRMLPPPNSSNSFNSTAPSLSYSISNPTSAQASPVTSRASSPTISTHQHQHQHQHAHNLAHSVRKAFGMTPIGAGASSPGNSSTASAGGGGTTARSPPTQHKLAPMSHSQLAHSIGVGQYGQRAPAAGAAGNDRGLPSLSRGNSPVHGHGHGHGHRGMEMEIDGHA